MPFEEEEKKFFEYQRKRFFSDSNRFISIVISQYNLDHGNLNQDTVLNETSDVLEKLISIGKSRWNLIRIEIQKEWVRNSLEDLSNLGSLYPNLKVKLSSLIQNIENSDDAIENITLVHETLYNFTSNFEFSNKQAAKNLAGATFEGFIKTLLTICGYSFETQKEITRGEALDFIYPNLNKVSENPADCIVTECQSTLKDRFRLSLGKVPIGNPISKFIFTLSGIGLVSSNDRNDLTENKIREIRDKGWKVVVLRKLKNEQFRDNQTVISYEDFFNTYYPAKSTLW
jgi:hypothetical protein